MYSDFVFLDRFLFELSCKHTHTHTNTDAHTHTHTHTHTDSNEYPIVAFSKNATIKIKQYIIMLIKIILIIVSTEILKMKPLYNFPAINSD